MSSAHQIPFLQQLAQRFLSMRVAVRRRSSPAVGGVPARESSREMLTSRLENEP